VSYGLPREGDPRHYLAGGRYDATAIKGDINGLYGRMPVELQKLVRKIRDAHNYDYAAMELLDAFSMEWRQNGE
jgi:hypothetical protein